MHLGRTDLSEFLRDRGVVEEADLQKARQTQARERIGFVKALQRACPTKTDPLLEAMSEYFAIPLMHGDRFLIDPMTVNAVPEEFARRHGLVPLFKVENELTVAVQDPRDIYAVDELRRITGCRINLVLSDEASIGKAIDKQYPEVARIEEEQRKGGQADQAGTGAEGAVPREVADLQSAAEEQGTVRIVNLILARAIQEGSSDIHLEPAEKKLRVRFRTDGLLKEAMEPPRELHPAITSRLKIMANLDIAEKRAPQDGRFQIAAAGKQLDVRLSTLPTIYGEKIVMRLLNSGQVAVSLDSLGLSPEQRQRFESWIGRPHGMILVTGPTGSGKTTTLYAALNRINTLVRNIVTVEDPVEYRLDLVNQVQVDPKANLTFASGLRSILRQDPDVIMVGEIRDRETAQMAVESALTGHLVLSTLHTNDAPGATVRLVDMGVEPFLISSALVGVVAQRLVRNVCPGCPESYVLGEDALPLDPALAGLAGRTLRRGSGCAECGYSGYRGRIGVYELMEISPAVREAIRSRASGDQVKALALSDGFRTMRQEGLRRVIEGATTLEELLRVTMESG